MFVFRYVIYMILNIAFDFFWLSHCLVWETIQEMHFGEFFRLNQEKYLKLVGTVNHWRKKGKLIGRVVLCFLKMLLTLILGHYKTNRQPFKCHTLRPNISVNSIFENTCVNWNVEYVGFDSWYRFALRASWRIYFWSGIKRSKKYS